MPIPFLAPLAPVFGALIKLILLGSLKFLALLAGMFLAPVWTERKLRTMVYGAALKGLRAGTHDERIPALTPERLHIVEEELQRAMQHVHTRAEARAILRVKLIEAARSVRDGIRELPGDVRRALTSFWRWLRAVSRRMQL